MGNEFKLIRQPLLAESAPLRRLKDTENYRLDWALENLAQVLLEIAHNKYKKANNDEEQDPN
jgi:hypothetical protein